MKKIVLVVLACLVSVSFAKERYKDRIFDVSVKKNVVYASDVKHLKELNSISKTLVTLAKLGKGTAVYLYDNETDLTKVDLHMDLYQPKGDKEKNRAAVVVLHGGAFAAGAKDDKDQQTVTYCDSLAARGYVTAAVEYRLGITATIENKTLHIDSLDFSRTVYRGIQDVRAAIRYLRANADDLGIDPARIYLVGNSAGAILSLLKISTWTRNLRFLRRQSQSRNLVGLMSMAFRDLLRKQMPLLPFGVPFTMSALSRRWTSRFFWCMARRIARCSSRRVAPWEILRMSLKT